MTVGTAKVMADIAEKMRIVSNILGDLPDEELQNVVEKIFYVRRNIRQWIFKKLCVVLII